jgi:hypothetical protein
VFMRGAISGVGIEQVLLQFPGAPGFSGSVVYDTSGRLVGLQSKYIVSRFRAPKLDAPLEVVVFSLSTHPKVVAEFLKGRE